MALIYQMWKLRMRFYEKQVAKETSKSLNVPIVFIYAFFWIWRVQNHVTRQIGEYEICLASMTSKSLASLASMNFPYVEPCFSINYLIVKILIHES